MNKDKIIKILIAILLIQLPFLDMLRTTTFKDIEFLGVTLIELGNILLVGIAFFLTLFKCNKKNFLLIFVYGSLIAIYIFLHFNNIIKFDTNIFERANFNFISESFYIFRVYTVPLVLLFVLIKNRKIFNLDFFLKIAKTVIIIISFSIVILNILKLSFISYGETHAFITNNIFDYFLYQGDYRNLSSRGWFDSANELSAILLMLFPINIYMLYREQKRSNVAIFIVQFLAMILLATRTSAIGALLIVIVAAVSYFFFILIKKDNISLFFTKTFLISSLCCTAFLFISPFMISRINENNYTFVINDQNAYSELENIDLTDTNNLDKMFEKYNNEYLINESFLRMYPVSNDPEFWLAMAKRDKALNNNSRTMKIDIIKRVKERNNNSSDSIWGMGYTLNFMDAEKDYYYQYYLFGWSGLLLFIVPYLAIIAYAFVSFLKNFKNSTNLKTILLFMSPLLGLAIAYYSGHVFGWVSPMIYLVMTVSILLVVVSQNKKVGEKDEK